MLNFCRISQWWNRSAAPYFERETHRKSIRMPFSHLSFQLFPSISSNLEEIFLIRQFVTNYFFVFGSGIPIFDLYYSAHVRCLIRGLNKHAPSSISGMPFALTYSWAYWYPICSSARQICCCYFIRSVWLHTTNVGCNSHKYILPFWK